MFRKGSIELVDAAYLEDMYGENWVEWHSEDTPVPYLKLPHQCDAWVIGGAEQVREMIVELQAMLAKMEKP